VEAERVDATCTGRCAGCGGGGPIHAAATRHRWVRYGPGELRAVWAAAGAHPQSVVYITSNPCGMKSLASTPPAAPAPRPAP
jgi:hypothetical protein